jgi:hypothetical protein
VKHVKEYIQYIIN